MVTKHRPSPAAVKPVEVWAVIEFHNCYGEDVVDLAGTPVIALYATEQTARQHAARDNAHVRRMPVLTALRGY